MAAKKSTNQTTEQPIGRVNKISDQITRRLTQLGGLCAVLCAADMDSELFDNDDLRATMWCMQDLLAGINNDHDAFYAIAIECIQE